MIWPLNVLSSNKLYISPLLILVCLWRSGCGLFGKAGLVTLNCYEQYKYLLFELHTYRKPLSTSFIATASTAIIILKTQEDQGREHHLMTIEKALKA